MRSNTDVLFHCICGEGMGALPLTAAINIKKKKTTKAATWLSIHIFEELSPLYPQKKNPALSIIMLIFYT